MFKIIELRDGDRLAKVPYLVTSFARCVSNAGRPYLNLTLQDSTGSLDCKKWEVGYDDEEIFAVGNVVEISGEVLSYQGKLQMKIIGGRKMEDYEFTASDFVQSSPIPKDELTQTFNRLLSSIENADIKRIVSALIEKHQDKYYDHPAAVKNHHAFASGLLYHSITMALDAEALCKIYPSLDHDILVGGALIHDLGKVEELSGPIATKYTLEGRLIGHICLLSAEIRQVAEELNIDGEIPLLLEHMVLSHHGQREFGAAALPSTREALALSMIDDFDAKMETLNKAYEGVEPGEWTARVMPMDNRCFYYPKYKKK
ncbi:MAG: HD domain-containing protein [Bacilli bacterium]|nr:HD domain-containing protein [Bacilli bacterium]